MGPTSPSGNIAEMVQLTERVANLEDDVASMQNHIGTLVALVKHIRNHAADAFNDRVAVAMNEVHEHIAGCIATVHERVQYLRSSSDGSVFSHSYQCQDGSLSET